MKDKQAAKRRIIFNSGNMKALIAALVFHIVYSFIFGMLIGGNNAFVFIYEKDWKTLYMIITPFIASLPYLISGYLITLGRNSYKQLGKKNINLFVISVFLILLVYFISFIAQYYFPFREMFGLFIFINYPAASYLIVMEFIEYSQNLLVLLSAIFPPIMTLIGGFLRIKHLNRGDINE